MRVAIAILLGGCNSILGIPTATAIGIDGTALDGTTALDAPVDPDLVHGTAIVTYWEATTHTMRPRDLSAWQFSALVPDASASGGFDVFHGTGAANGTFQVPGVPAGVSYELEVVAPTSVPNVVATTYRVGTARTFDLGGDALGRPDVVLTTQPTNLILNLDNLQAYVDTDFLEVACINNGGFVFDFTHSPSIMAPPAVGATALAGVSFDWSQPDGAGTPRNPVMNGDLGDTLAVIQESSTTLPSGAIVQTMTRIYSEKFNQPDGAPHTITAAFTTLAPTLTLDATYARSQFEAHRAEVNPMTKPVQDADYTYGDSLLPSPDGHPQYAGTLDLVVSSLPAGTTDQAYGPFSYPDPFPSTWEHLRIASAGFKVPFSVDGGSMSVLNRAWVSSRNLDFTPGVTLVDVVAPTISPVRAAHVNGVDVFAGGTISTTTATILSWTAPAIGTAARYDVQLFRAYNDTGKTRFAREATLETADTQVAIPRDRFTAGSHYIFVVMAISSLDSANAETAPMIGNVWTAM